MLVSSLVSVNYEAKAIDSRSSNMFSYEYICLEYSLVKDGGPSRTLQAEGFRGVSPPIYIFGANTWDETLMIKLASLIT